jgi:predicted transglutaminase-like cysteine proteinase
MDKTQLVEFWNNKHPKQKVIYAGRSTSKKCDTCGQFSPLGGLKLDVRNMVTANDELLKEIIQSNNLQGSSFDDTMIRIQRWVCSKLKYVYDEKNQGALEHWQFPFETLASFRGDCEDGALLMASLALNAGIPSFRVRVTAGLVQEAPTAPTGGHGYLTYLRESDNEWVVVDWCFFGDPQVEIAKKPIIKSNSLYKEIWFSFNNEHSWAHKEFEVSQKMR